MILKKTFKLIKVIIKKLSLFSIILMLSLLGCTSASEQSTSLPESADWVRHKQWSDNANIVDLNVSRHSTALLVGFVAPENRYLAPRERPSTAQFDLQKDESFSTLLILGVGGEIPRTLLISVFLDYQQVPFRLDEQLGLLHEVEIDPHQDMEIPLELDVQTSGWHDMFVVVFPDPNSHPTSIEERQFSDFSVGGRRTVLCKENCTISKELPLFKSQIHVGQEAKLSPSDISAWPLIAGDEPAFERVLFAADADPHEKFSLQLWAGNPSDEERNYVVLPLLNYQSFIFSQEPRVHLQMPPNSELFIPSELVLSAEPQVHELQFITIFDPYQSLQTVDDPFVNSILRSAIVVEQTQ